MKPVPKKYTLNTSEVLKVQGAIEEYNSVIKSVASAKHLAFVDINKMMKKL